MLYYSGYKFTFELYLPSTLRRFTLFEDFNEDFNSHYQKSIVCLGERVRTPSLCVSAVLAKVSTWLEQLSASFLVDAKDFFHVFQSEWIWKDLESLALTSKLLNIIEDTAKAKNINNMFHAAGVAARNMPKLQIMEIWTGGRGHASIFRYRVTDDFTTLSWHSVWDLQLESRVIKAWEEVARDSQYSRHELRVETRQIPSNDIQSHADAIDKLVLKKHVLHPVSLSQIRIDAKKMEGDTYL